MPGSLTLLIPVYRSASFLQSTLETAYAWLQGLDRETELLLVEDGSPDESLAVLKAFKEELEAGKHRSPRPGDRSQTR